MYKKNVESLVDYIKFIDDLKYYNFIFRFNNGIDNEELYESFIEYNFDNKQISYFKREGYIAKIWERIFPIKEKLYNQALFNKYGNVTVETKFYFRGLSNKEYKNVPGIYRGNRANTRPENYFFNEIQVRCPSSFSGMRNINKLTFMQHYGCPTRLLDITSNPLVALYFACLGSDKEDGVVHVFGVSEDDIHYGQSDRVQMLSKFAEFKSKEQEQLLILSYIYLLKGKFPQGTNSKYIDSVVERFYQAIKRDNGAFEREIVPLDLLKPLFVQVDKDNPRILKQDGAFIMSGLAMNELDSSDKINFYKSYEIIVPAFIKKSLRDQLEKVSINQASLFPEVEQVSSYLKQKM